MLISGYQREESDEYLQEDRVARQGIEREDRNEPGRPGEADEAVPSGHIANARRRTDGRD